VTSLQTGLGDRCVVAVVAAGPTFAVEDLLAAGEVIDALAASGIDHSSPEAAAACAAFTGLRRAVKHLVSASENGVALAEREQMRGA
jgi:phosphosulfolactate phosphohydrolase-like enzyme